MNWETFFENNVNGYLLCDLREMNKINVDGAGNCGYPMLMTILSGMELLGGLSFTDDKWLMDKKGKKYFKYFYTNYFQKYNILYEQEGWKEFYTLLRHKLAHTFLTALKYKIAKNSMPKPIIHSDNSVLIDVGLIYEDFKMSVRDLENDLRSDVKLAERFEKHLNDIFEAYGPVPSRTLESSRQKIPTTLSGMLNNDIHRYTSLATTSIPSNNLKIIRAEDVKPDELLD